MKFVIRLLCRKDSLTTTTTIIIVMIIIIMFSMTSFGELSVLLGSQLSRRPLD